MKNTYFPVPLAAMQATLHFHTLNDGSYEVGGCTVQTMHLNHPGSTIGYRVTLRGKSVCYMCDNEITDEDPDYRLRLQEFMREAHIVVADAQYIPEDFPGKQGWGHSK